MPLLPQLRSTRKSTAFIAVAALLLWIALSASHFHFGEEATSEGGARCVICLSLPSAAAPPPALREAVLSIAWAVVLPAPRFALLADEVPSSYRSRAPPR